MILSLFHWIDKRLGIKESQEKVSRIKKNATDKMDETTATLNEATRLQKKIMKKTTTFYIAKAMGKL